MHLQGIFKFSNIVPVNEECLGKKFYIKVGLIDGTLITPGEAISNEPFKNGLQMTSNCQISTEDSWGFRSSSKASGLQQAMLTFDIIQLLTETEEQDFLKNLSMWEKRFFENISVISGFDLIPRKQGEDDAVIDSNKHQLTWVQGNEKKKIRSHVTLFFESQIFAEGCSLEQFEKSLEVTNRFQKPLFEYYFLLDANRALSESNYRKSILDSATALEICLSNIIENKLCGSEDFKNRLMKDYYSLAKKINLLKSLGITLPQTTNENVLTVRNKTIHRGYEPTRNEAVTAYSSVKKILDGLVPNKFE